MGHWQRRRKNPMQIAMPLLRRKGLDAQNQARSKRLRHRIIREQVGRVPRKIGYVCFGQNCNSSIAAVYL
jgi:hypothetical protein